MDHFLIRTKLQATIARAMIDAGLARRDAVIHLIVTDSSGDEHLNAARRLFSGHEVRRRTSRRGPLGRSAFTTWLWWLILRARLGGQRVFVANLHWASLGLALRLLPGARLHGFDDGTANVQRRPGAFLWEQGSQRHGVVGTLSRLLFPRGVPAFVRTRLVRHATIYPGKANVLPPDRIDVVAIDWASLIEPADRDRLPDRVRRILIGSVYAELNRRLDLPVPEATIERCEAWADLHLPHPRQPVEQPVPDVLLRYPAEAIIEHYARQGWLQVAHFDSSVALSFDGDPRIGWINLLTTGGVPGGADNPGETGDLPPAHFGEQR